MEPIRQSFSVTYQYDVLFTRKIFSRENALLKNTIDRLSKRFPANVLFVIEEAITAAFPGMLADISTYIERHRDTLYMPGPCIVVKGGEDVKNKPELVTHIQKAIETNGICRHSYVIAIGGGALLDMAGFAAATAHRGVRHIRIPTTVLAQNDSGVGVKNGINAFGSKNFAGSFAPPQAVINDSTFLQTLPDRDWRAGISEAIKVALIKDRDFFEQLERHAALLAPPTRDANAMERLIYRCAALHVEHIGSYGDPFEMGSSRPLDFGHWAAHKLEMLTEHRLRHGEAVAIGIALDATYSMLSGRLTEEELHRIVRLFESLGFALFAPELESRLDQPDHPGSLFAGLEDFRTHLGGELTIMLLDAIGTGFEVHEVDLSMYQQAISLLKKRCSTEQDL